MAETCSGQNVATSERIPCSRSGGHAILAETVQATSRMAALPLNNEGCDMENKDKTINYIEFPLVDANATKAFYGAVFGWVFQDWGPTYISFSGAAVEGGFNGESGVAATAPGVLVVLYGNDLEALQSAVEAAGAEVVRPIYAFPGGRRFHFRDPNGNELAIWSET